MPFAIEYPEAQDALYEARMAANVPEFAPVGGDPFAYWKLMHELWLGGRSFIIVEHDIVVRPTTVGELEYCERAYCSFPYLQLPGEPVTGLGCTKFDRTVLRAVDPFTPKRDVPWQNVDYEICSRVREVFLEHVHRPPLRHLNPKAGSSG